MSIALARKPDHRVWLLTSSNVLLKSLLSICLNDMNDRVFAVAVTLPEVAPKEAQELQPGLVQQRLVQPDARILNTAAPAITVGAATKEAGLLRPLPSSSKLCMSII